MEEYYNKSEIYSKSIDQEIAHAIIHSWLPSIILLIREERFEETADTLKSFLVSLNGKIVVTASVA